MAEEQGMSQQTEVKFCPDWEENCIRTEAEEGEKSTCFLCLRETNTEKEICLRSICRYLKINIQQIYTSKRHDHRKEDADKFPHAEKNQDFSVDLCNHCSSILVQLSHQCTELELLQMKVDHSLKSVLEIIDSSDAPEHSNSHLSDMLICGRKEKSRQEYVMFRNEIKRKCQVQLNRSFPRVKLTNDSLLPFGGNTLQNNCVSEMKCSPPSSPSPTVETGGKQLGSENVVQGLLECKSKPVSRKKKERSNKPCNLCNPPRMINTNGGQRHKIACHLEHWFSSAKQDDITEVEFKEYCKHVVKLEIRFAEKLCDAKANPSDIMKCAYCPYSLGPETSSHQMRFQDHVCGVHKEVVVEKLVQLQQSTSLEEIKAVQLGWSKEDRSRSKRPALTCNVCARVYGSYHALWRHKKEKHGKGVFRNLEKFNCEACDKVFRTSELLFNHKKMTHMSLDGNSTFKCEICGEDGFPHASSVLRHKRAKHGKNAQGRSWRKKFLKSKSKPDPGTSPSTSARECNLCNPPRMLNVSSNGTQRHDIACHLEHWFGSCKQPQITLSEFREYCKHVVELELRACEKLYDAKGNPVIKCANCPYTRPENKMQRMRQHVCAVHRKFLVRKLTELQQSTTLEEMKAIQLRWSRKDRAQSGNHKCDVCDKVYASRKGLWHHKNGKHGGKATSDKECKCDVCDEVFQNFDDLTKHKKIKHEMSLDSYCVINCDVCGKGFPYSSSLLKHKRAKHTTGKTADQVPKCDICGKVFKLSYSLAHHKKIKHLIVSVIKCDICNKSFDTQTNLEIHEKIEHGKGKAASIRCNICGMVFKHTPNLYRHKRVQHGNGKLKKAQSNNHVSPQDRSGDEPFSKASVPIIKCTEFHKVEYPLEMVSDNEVGISTDDDVTAKLGSCSSGIEGMGTEEEEKIYIKEELPRIIIHDDEPDNYSNDFDDVEMKILPN